jgi:hypothetical protein
MNANSSVAQAALWEIEAWREPRSSSLPTLVGSVLTVVAVLALWTSAGAGWPVTGPSYEPVAWADFAHLPPVSEQPGEVPSPPRPFQAPESETGLAAPAYFLVATEAQAAQAEVLLAIAAGEEIQGARVPPARFRYVRWVDTPEAEVAVMAELAIATESWAASGKTVGVVDLR